MYAATRSEVLSARDSRCQYWAKILTPAQSAGLRPATIAGAGDLPGAYLRRGADVEIPLWGVLLEGEANHHAKARGWTFDARIVFPMESAKTPGEPVLQALPYGVEAKKIIKRIRPELVAGSGEHAAMARSAAFVIGAATDSDAERWSRWFALLGHAPTAGVPEEVKAAGAAATANWLAARSDPRGEGCALALARGYIA